MGKFITIFLSLLFVLSCGSVPHGEDGDFKTKDRDADYTKSAQAYMPLAVGNTWNYSVDYLGQKGEMSVVIEKKEGEWFIDNHHGKLRIDRRGIRDESRYLLQFPLVEKRAWLAILKPGQTEHFSINKVAAAVKTPAGSWDTAVVVQTTNKKDKDKELLAFHYFVPKVGIVKIETYIRDIRSGKAQLMTMTLLTSYTLK
ncbi:hypothetical protein KAH37_08435 [bacterium]|nr:hypothetical protein [bacterium]